MVNRLTEIRQEIADVLNAAGIKTVDYVQENLVPPVAVVVPGVPYVTLPTGQNPYGEPYSVGVNILLMGGKGTNRTAAEKIDSMIVDVLNALDDWDVVEVYAGMELKWANIPFLGAVVTLETNTNLDKEVM